MSNSKTYFKKNISLAWPLAVNALLVQSMLMIDTLLVAPLGELPVAAMGIAATIVACALGIETAIGNGVQLLVGRAYGSGNSANLVVAYWVGLFINTATSLILFFSIVVFGSELIAVLTDDPVLISLVESYLAITKYIILLTAYAQICTSFYNGCGLTKTPLMAYLFEIPINAVLSYVLIYGYGEFRGIGLEGAAWGSLVAILLRTVYFFIVMRNDKEVDLKYPRDKPFLVEIGTQFSEIFPIAANFFVLFIGASIYQFLFSQLDLSSFVAITLIFPWFRIGTQFVAAWAHASAINISQVIGQKDFKNLKIFISTCRQAAFALTLIIAGLFLLLSQNIHLIYPKLETETQIALAIIAPIYILLPIVRGYNSVSANILRALGDSELALKVNFVAQWLIALPLCALLILHFKVSVFWAFAMMPFEEILKIYHFSHYTKLNLAHAENPDHSA